MSDTAKAAHVNVLIIKALESYLENGEDGLSASVNDEIPGSVKKIVLEAVTTFTATRAHRKSRAVCSATHQRSHQTAPLRSHHRPLARWGQRYTSPGKQGGSVPFRCVHERGLRPHVLQCNATQLHRIVMHHTRTHTRTQAITTHRHRARSSTTQSHRPALHCSARSPSTRIALHCSAHTPSHKAHVLQCNAPQLHCIAINQVCWQPAPTDTSHAHPHARRTSDEHTHARVHTQRGAAAQPRELGPPRKGCIFSVYAISLLFT